MRGTHQRVVLPESMQPIVDAIGSSAALSLVHVFAGAKVCFPKPSLLTYAHPIAKLLGMPLAQRLVDALGGQEIIIPRCERVLLDHRDAEICRRLDADESTFKLAQDYGITDRAIRSIGARRRKVAVA